VSIDQAALVVAIPVIANPYKQMILSIPFPKSDVNNIYYQMKYDVILKVGSLFNEVQDFSFVKSS